jgi:hypothetical protein
MNESSAQSGGEEMKTPGEEFIRWAMQHCRMKEVYDQFEFANDATGFNTFCQPIVIKINKIFKERSTPSATPATEPSTGMRLIQKQKEYIAFLDKHLSDLTGFTYAHGIRFNQEDIDEGLRRRKEIAELEAAPEPPTPVLPEVKEGDTQKWHPQDYSGKNAPADAREAKEVEIPKDVMDWIGEEQSKCQTKTWAMIRMYQKVTQPTNLEWARQGKRVYDLIEQLSAANARIQELCTEIAERKKLSIQQEAKIQELEAKCKDLQEWVDSHK